MATLRCWINVIAAGGIVLAPDDSRACRCAYQNQASVALKEYGERPPRVTVASEPANYAYDIARRSYSFVGKLIIEMSHPKDDVETRYTLDDSYPTVGSALYTGPITLTETTPVRASAFRNGRKVAVRDGPIFTKVRKLDTTTGKKGQ